MSPGDKSPENHKPAAKQDIENQARVVHECLPASGAANPSQPGTGFANNGHGVQNYNKVLPKVEITNTHQIKSAYDQLTPQRINTMSLNDARDALHDISQDLRERGYDPRERLLGFGTENNNPNNPFANPEDLYRPDSRNVNLIDICQRAEQIQANRQRNYSQDNFLADSLPFNGLAQADKRKADPFSLNNLPTMDKAAFEAQEQKYIEGILLATSSPEQQRQYAQWQAIEHERQWDQSMRRPSSLEVRLKTPVDQLTPEQQKIYREQQDLQKVLRTGDAVANHIDQLQAEYDRNHWHEDSHWFGVDDKKFLEDIRSRNPYNISDYDKFRTLATVDHIRSKNPEIFAAKDLDKLTPEQRQLRTDIETQESASRRQLVERLRHEVTKLDIVLGNQQGKQGLVSGAADSLIGHIGTPGGWGGMFMDSDATSQATQANLEKARQVTQSLLALSEFKGNNVDFAKAYQDRTKHLGQSLELVSDNLDKMSQAHQGRIEGISDIVSATAAVSAIIACASAAPETFCGSLVAIPVVAPMAAGAAGKTMTKFLESGTSVTGEAYTMPDVLQDASIAALTSMPLMPGNALARTLIQAESKAIKQLAVTEVKQLVITAEKSTIWRSILASKTLLKDLAEKTPAEIFNLSAKQTTYIAKQAAKQGLGYATAGGIDGALIGGARGLVKGEDPLEHARQGLVGGAIMGPVMGPIIKHGAGLTKKGLDWLKTNPAPIHEPHANTGMPKPQTSPSSRTPSVMEIPRPFNSNIRDMTPGPEGPGGMGAASIRPSDLSRVTVKPEAPALPRIKTPSQRSESQVGQRFQSALDEVTGPSGKTLTEEGWVVELSDKGSARDHIKADIVVRNTKTGDYYTPDVTENRIVDGRGLSYRSSSADKAAKVVRSNLHWDSIVKRDDVLNTTDKQNLIDSIFKPSTKRNEAQHPLPPKEVLPPNETRRAVAQYRDSLLQSNEPAFQEFGRSLNGAVSYLEREAAAHSARVQTEATIGAFKESGGYDTAANNLRTAVENVIKFRVRAHVRESITIALDLARRSGQPSQIQVNAPKVGVPSVPRQIVSTQSLQSNAGNKSGHQVERVGVDRLRLTTDSGLQIDCKIDRTSIKSIVQNEWKKATDGIPQDKLYVVDRIKNAVQNIEQDLLSTETIDELVASIRGQKIGQLLGEDFKDPLARSSVASSVKIPDSSAQNDAELTKARTDAARVHAVEAETVPKVKSELPKSRSKSLNQDTAAHRPVDSADQAQDLALNAIAKELQRRNVTVNEDANTSNELQKVVIDLITDDRLDSTVRTALKGVNRIYRKGMPEPVIQSINQSVYSAMHK